MSTSAPSVDPARPIIVGRSSSHFTRVLRLFAEECGVPYDFRVVPSLLSLDAADYGGNPGLRLPNLVTAAGTAFGSLPCCRLVERMRREPIRMLWPEQTPSLLPANALELTVQAMSTEVSLILVEAAGGHTSRYGEKLRVALAGMVAWLDTNLPEVLGQLPLRDLSYFELALFCLVDHLEFREVMSMARYARLCAFRERFAERPAAVATAFMFDT